MPAVRRTRREQLATLALVAVTTVWGSTFVLIKHVVETVPVADFLAVRFVIAAALMLALFGRRVARLSRAAALRGLGLGAVYGAAQLLQTAGLARTSASVAGFVTGMYVVLTPVLGLLLLRQKAGRSTWLAVASATLGLGLLSLRGTEVSAGVLLVLASTVLYALHILGLGLWSSSRDAMGLAAVQMAGIAAVCTVGALPGGVTLPPDGSAWTATLYTAIGAGALAILLQTWAQAHLTATRAAIVMTLEPVAAAAFAVGFGEALTGRMVLGGLFVLGAMYLVELSPRPPGPAAQSPPREMLHHEV
ncbi:MAG: DMT family transporter [Actinomycetales bacterium]